MKNVIKKNSKLIIAFSLGFILSIGTVFAASKLYASKVSVDTTSMPALGSESNVEEALTYLYQRAADAGLTGTGNHSVVPTKYRNVYETYLDPTNLSRKCTAAEVVSTTGTNSGCMKWYIFDWSETNYTMILDHNIGEMVVYGNKGTSLANATSSWDSRLMIRFLTNGDYNRIGQFLESGYSNNYISGGTGSTLGYYFYSTYAPGGCGSFSACFIKGGHYLGFVFENLEGCTTYGCAVEDSSAGKGYWTEYYVNIISNSGSNTSGSTSDTYMVRPVIEISKAIF